MSVTIPQYMDYTKKLYFINMNKMMSIMYSNFVSCMYFHKVHKYIGTDTKKNVGVNKLYLIFQALHVPNESILQMHLQQNL